MLSLLVFGLCLLIGSAAAGSLLLSADQPTDAERGAASRKLARGER